MQGASRREGVRLLVRLQFVHTHARAWFTAMVTRPGRRRTGIVVGVAIAIGSTLLIGAIATSDGTRDPHAPIITSAWRDVVTPGQPMKPFTVTDTGYPVPTLQASGLPPGVHFTDNGNRSGIIVGIPESAAAGSYLVMIVATNQAGTARQAFELTVMNVKSRRTLLLVAGQSNAVGFQSYATDPMTGVDYFAPPYSNGADVSSTISWMPSSKVAPAGGGGATGQVPLDTPQLLSDARGGRVRIFGPEIGWARQIYSDTGQGVSVVKAAFAGTNLAVGWNPKTPGGIYSRMIAKVISTMSADARAGQLDTIGGVAWAQGERDALRPALAAEYTSNLKAFIAALRSDLPMAPTTPIVLVKESLEESIALNERNGKCDATRVCAVFATGDAEVRAADDWAATHLPNVLVVDTLGRPRVADLAIHLTNTSELAVGRDIGIAIRRAQHRRAGGAVAAVPGDETATVRRG